MATVVLSFGGREIKAYDLTKPATVVGRDPGVDIVIDNLGVSRSHCQFLRRNSTYILQDMNSSNGTFVNGQKIGEHNLNNGDTIIVGKYTLTFRNENQQAAAVGIHDKIVPDSLNTYMMDSNKIRERMEEMRRAEQAKASPAAPSPAPAAPAPAEAVARPAPQAAPVAAAPSAPAQSAAAPASQGSPSSPISERGEHHPRVVMSSGFHGSASAGKLKKYLYMSLALNVILLAALATLLAMQALFAHQ